MKAQKTTLSIIAAIGFFTLFLPVAEMNILGRTVDYYNNNYGVISGLLLLGSISLTLAINERSIIMWSNMAAGLISAAITFSYINKINSAFESANGVFGNYFGKVTDLYKIQPGAYLIL